MSKAKSVSGFSLSLALFSGSLVLVAGYRHSRAPWQYTPEEVYVSGLSVAAFLVAAVALSLSGPLHKRELWKRLMFAVMASVAATYAVVFFLYFLNIGISRISVLAALVLMSTGISSYAVFGSRQITLTIGFLLFILTFIPSYRALHSGDQLNFASSSKFIFSGYDDLRVTNFELSVDSTQDGGAIAYATEDWALLVTGKGDFIRLLLDGANIVPEMLSVRAPLGLDGYYAGTRIPSRWYRVTDAILQPKPDGRYLVFVTHTYWDAGDDCYTLRVSRTVLDKDLILQQELWDTLFESTPCATQDINNEMGGRMAFLDDDSLLVTVGSFKFEDANPHELLQSDYGKIHLLDLKSGNTAIYSTGHRNAQGLVVTGSGIWATEHGPYGGDELNRIVRGLDYGWPYQSYGTDYGKKTLSLTSTFTGDHSAAERPVYAWIPSIGISNLIEIQGDAFRWKGDLLIGSLNGLGAGYSLFRIRVRAGRAITIEKVQTGDKVRDLVELRDGRIMLWNGLTKIQMIEPSRSVFSACAACHALRRASHGIGPDLWGVVGSEVARHDRYEYSQAMEELGGRWTPGRLDEFLADPGGTVPGTTMDFAGIQDAQTRKEIINYLRDLAQDR